MEAMGRPPRKGTGFGELAGVDGVGRRARREVCSAEPRVETVLFVCSRRCETGVEAKEWVSGMGVDGGRGDGGVLDKRVVLDGRMCRAKEGVEEPNPERVLDLTFGGRR